MSSEISTSIEEVERKSDAAVGARNELRDAADLSAVQRSRLGQESVVGLGRCSLGGLGALRPVVEHIEHGLFPPSIANQFHQVFAAGTSTANTADFYSITRGSIAR